jgi:hypothetical protein
MDKRGHSLGLTSEAQELSDVLCSAVGISGCPLNPKSKVRNAANTKIQLYMDDVFQLRRVFF